MTEERVRTLAAELAEALLEVVRAEASRPAVPPKLISIEEATALLGIKRTAFYGLIRDGRVRTHKIGRRRLVSVASLADLAGADRPADLTV